MVISLSRVCVPLPFAGEVGELRNELASSDIDVMKDAVKKVRLERNEWPKRPTTPQPDAHHWLAHI